jgi:GNAT superfamily N-acetyltransferase
MKLRMAAPGDAKRIADLHAESWRRHYRGAYLDTFLDGDIFSERLAVWSERLARPDAQAFTILAVDQDALLGFAHTIADHDAVYGALLDNLHVRPDQMRGGMGSALMRETATMLERRRKTSGLYLWVLEQNRSAQEFYSAKGGIAVGREIIDPLPGGGSAPALRYHWPHPVAIV